MRQQRNQSHWDLCGGGKRRGTDDLLWPCPPSGSGCLRSPWSAALQPGPRRRSSVQNANMHGGAAPSAALRHPHQWRGQRRARRPLGSPSSQSHTGKRNGNARGENFTKMATECCCLLFVGCSLLFAVVSCCLLLIAVVCCCLLLSAVGCCQLLSAVSCQLSAVSCLLVAVCCLLSAGCWLLVAGCWLLFVVRCSLFVVRCSLFVVRRCLLLFVVVSYESVCPHPAVMQRRENLIEPHA